VGTDPTTEVHPDPDSPATPRAGESVAGTEGDGTHEDQSPEVAWRTVASPDRETGSDAPVSARRVVVQLGIGILVVLAVVTVGGSLAARKLAEREAVNDAVNLTDVFAETVIRPALTDQLAAGQPAAQETFDDLVHAHVLGSAVTHVKLWTPDGKVVYADEPDLVGQTFDLDDDQEAALDKSETRADISNLDRDENTLDGQAGDKLVEVYRPVWTDSGQKMLFEIYAPYDQVSQRTGQLWRGFAGVTLSSLLLFLVLIAPLFWHLFSRVRRNQQQRELLLQRAVDASSSERRLIAATLHDGPVQDLAATSFVVAGATARAKAAEQHWLVDELQSVAGSVRASIRALRSLLVDIYPASLAQAGLGAALDDLVQSLHAPGLEVRLHHDDAEQLGLTPAQERLVYRIAQETLRNAAKHAVPCTATVTLYRVGDEVVLDVLDDGNGFDLDERLNHPEPGHFGLQLLADLAATGGALLQVASVPRRGTHWRLRVPQGDGADLETEESPHD
jgi:two-component system, NarL family, sensor kinase